MTNGSGHGSSAAPQLSVVVVSFNGVERLRRCLTALMPEALMCGAEVLVSANWCPPPRTIDELAEMFPTVRWVRAAADTTVPLLRRLGITASRGAVVALIEDDCEVASGWCEAAVATLQSDAVAVGGAVEPGPYTRGLDWGVYFCEYGRYMLPLPARRTVDLACNNVAYKREALEALPAEDGFYDVFVHRRWADDGRILRSDGTLVVRNTNLWAVRHVTTVPFHHGRAFGGQRSSAWPRLARLGAALVAPVLPVLAVARIMQFTLRRRRYVARLLQAFPWVILFTTSWSLGEGLGYLLGPGDSPGRWR